VPSACHYGSEVDEIQRHQANMHMPSELVFLSFSAASSELSGPLLSSGSHVRVVPGAPTEPVVRARASGSDVSAQFVQACSRG
jgi:hypothetical protein